MATRHKILLLDDDPDLLEMYRQILGQMPSGPEIHTATSGRRALAMLEAEPFRLLICDLKMPKMDGLQVLSIVRRKFPQLRTVVLTSVLDEQFRSRAYALGVDLFWHKPATEDEIRMFLECLESLLDREMDQGFRGVQSKSLVDIIQLECLSQSSAVLRLTNNQFTGKVWIQDGEIIDAEAEDLRGEAAFQRILSWRAGHFETLPADPARERTIFKSYNGLLLESAQALDESRSEVGPDGLPDPSLSPVAMMSQVAGVDFVLVLDKTEGGEPVCRGLENPKEMASCIRQNLRRLEALGERLQAGQLEQFQGFGMDRNVAVASHENTAFCVGWKSSLTSAEMREGMKKVLSLWAF